MRQHSRRVLVGKGGVGGEARQGSEQPRVVDGDLMTRSGLYACVYAGISVYIYLSICLSIYLSICIYKHVYVYM